MEQRVPLAVPVLAQLHLTAEKIPLNCRVCSHRGKFLKYHQPSQENHPGLVIPRNQGLVRIYDGMV